MKRLAYWVLAAMVLFSCVSIALPTKAAEETTISIMRYSLVKSSLASLTINGKQASCSGLIRANDSSASVSVTATLQKKSGSAWAFVDSWSSTGLSGAAGITASGTKTLSSGTYRVKLSGTVTINGSSESVTAYSAEKTY